MDVAARISEIVEPMVSDMGYALVRVQFKGGKPPTLQIMAERQDGTMSVDDCAELSQALSAVLDVEDPIQGEYNLEVSSPGVDRPLVKLSDFERFAGLEAKVELTVPLNGRRKYRGRLKGVEDGHVVIAVDDGEHRLPHESIAQAKLVLTDELLNEPARPIQ